MNIIENIIHSSMASTNLENTTSTPVRTLGIVKWFNKKQGYGFIHVLNGEQKDKDIFVHYSSIRTKDTEYKYLVQGEYVEFFIERVVKEDHEFNASDVTGLFENPILCETRRLAMLSRPYNNHNNDTNDEKEGGHRRSNDASYNRPRKRLNTGATTVIHDSVAQVDSEGFARVNVGKKQKRAAAKIQKPSQTTV